MCGIYGWLGNRGSSADPVAVGRLLHHRGPDDSGWDSGERWGLGFRRLSILDLSPSGHQPMRSACGRYCLVFNGEIYNYLELREELRAAGCVFRGSSDTEVLLQLLLREGAAALGRLNGMFALAWVDLVEQRFLLARDRLGVKPLYYALHGGGLVFASELKGLLPSISPRPSVDPAAIVEYLALGYLPGDRAIFLGVHKLPPGSQLSGPLDNIAQASPTRYWKIEIGDPAESTPPASRDGEELERLLDDAVRIRLRSDVPVGVFLSGGIDSGLVATLAARHGSPVAFTVGFAEPEFDETALAAGVARHAGLPHRVVPAQEATLDVIDRLAWHFDEPFGDSSALPTYLLCEAAAEHAIVFLAGDGGDEAFGGYRRYVEAGRLGWAARLPGAVGAILRSSSGALPAASPLAFRLRKLGLPAQGYAAAFDAMPEDPILREVLHGDLRALAAHAGRPLWAAWAKSAGRSVTARQQQLDYDLYLPDDILTKVDRASMAHSIEVRSPFLDYRVVEWAARLSRASLLNARQGKLPLRALAERLLPAASAEARKRGFGVPLAAWFRADAGQAFLRDRLLSPTARQRRWWDTDAVEKICAIHLSGRGRDFSALLWRLLMLEAWARWYADGKRYAEGPPGRLVA
jgi:asparagine synthase (glutamine-hydrolysing)